MNDLFTKYKSLLDQVRQEALRYYPQDLNPNSTDDGYASVGILGGGTAGYMSAIALKRQLPHLEVTVVESSDIPIIGVGEATVAEFIPFLHYFLGLDIVELYEEIKPTWKQGIRFEWGLPGDYHFNYSFSYRENDIGLLGSLACDGTINSANLQSILMDVDLVPVFVEQEGQAETFISSMRFAYHLENKSFVRYLQKKAIQLGVKHIDCQINDAQLASDGKTITTLIASDNRRLSYDLYIDCSGFRSLLLEKKMGSKYTSFASTLFTDTAVIGVVPNQDYLKPYTTATTMDSGWCWNIPVHNEDHIGYVYSSGFMDEERARAEVLQLYPHAQLKDGLVSFRSGRHDEFWKGNVVGVGNSYGFVEPLESTGLMMIAIEIASLIHYFPASKAKAAVSKKVLNDLVGSFWDSIRWFLGLHYKFNRRKDTLFWQEAREKTDISGMEDLVEMYKQGAPLAARGVIDEFFPVRVFGIHGVDIILGGQQVPTRLLPFAGVEAWQQKKAIANEIKAKAMRHKEGLDVLSKHPDLLQAMVSSPHSWMRRSFFSQYSRV